ncbi:MAG TPA: xanthine dehydrogenase family protein molybdopterin-binding subunit [Bacteroidota bacterium]
MTTLNVTRRDFIKVSALTGGGFLLGFRLSSDSELIAGSEFTPNVWLKIASDGAVTITVHRSEMGQGVWTSFPMIVAEELEADWSKVSIEQADAHPTKYGSQSTGGSYSIRGNWQTLRNAGATAREMLITAAANQWKVGRSECRAESGHVVHSSGKKLSYGELAAAAATLPVPDSVKFKDNKDFRIIGTRIKKLDTPAKVYGNAVFGLDVRVPGMLFASIEQCRVFGGKVVSFDASKAKAVPGVQNVVQVESGVAVIATNTWAAFRGREELSVTWDEGKWAGQSSASIRKMFQEALASKGNIENYAGDAESALTGAATKLEAVYEAPFVAHQTMETMNCTADVRADRCEIWAPTQSPQGIQRDAARVLGLDLDKVTVHVTLMGGGFGRRLFSDFAIDAVHVSRAAGKPVQVVWTREDDTQHDFYRPMTYNILKAGLNKDGMPAAWIHRIAGPSARGTVVGGSTPPYTLPNFRVEAHILETGIPIGPWRSVGPSQNGWIIESFIDELAHAAKKDPFEYRRSLLAKSPRLKRTLEFVAEKAGWNKPLPKEQARGIACVESFGSACAMVAEVSVENGEPKVHRIVAAVDCGPVVNPDTVEAQMEGAIVYGLSSALRDEITIEKGRVQQESYDDYRMLQFDEMPKMEIYTVPSTEPVGGIGEPGLPPAIPSVCNAIFAATGIRIRKLPIRPADLKRT